MHLILSYDKLTKWSGAKAASVNEEMKEAVFMANEKTEAVTTEKKEVVSRNFIEEIIDEDLAEGRYEKICTRFPPEPNGYLHIGHAKSILLNYGLAKEYNGDFNLRFDDTNPTKEKIEFVESIKKDVEWLGADFGDRLYFASDYFGIMYDKAVLLIKKGLAYVCDLSAEEIREYRGTLKEPGKNSPYRDRSIEENLKLFTEMKEGVYPDGSKVLRAKIDMSAPNINMRDPVLYRIARLSHHNTGDAWCIYPMYDFAHPIEDAIEGITHSICTLEFEDHRPLYEWVVDNTEWEHPPKQIEFAKMYLTNVVTGKRYIKRLVEDGIVDGWDDPRLVTIAALRRRGFTPESIQKFVELVGVAKADSSVDPEAGKRLVPFGRELYIERDDFMETPIPKYKRLYPGNEVRLMHAYFVKAVSCEKDENGNVTVVHCTYDPETKVGTGFTGRKVKGTIHWVPAKEAVTATVRLYENLVDEEKGVYNKEDGSLNLNPNSLTVIENAKLEPALLDVKPYDSFQFVRSGYYCVDAKDSVEGAPVFNRIVTMKSSFKLPK